MRVNSCNGKDGKVKVATEMSKGKGREEGAGGDTKFNQKSIMSLTYLELLGYNQDPNRVKFPFCFGT